MDEMKKPTVLFLAGTGRSGTTILSSILGQVPGCFNAGEIRYTWERGILLDHRCGCGETFSRCPVWGSIMDRVASYGGRPDPRKLSSSIDHRTRVRRVPAMLLRRLLNRPAIPAETADANVALLYRSIASRPGCEVIVDSSKLPPYGLLVSGIPDIDFRVLHLVRDPRATAFSWRRQKQTHDANDTPTMPLLETWRSAVLWLLWNALAARWWPTTSGRNIFVRYEDLMTDPQRVLTVILGALEMQLPPGLLSGHSVRLSPTHSVAGNPGRHRVGAVDLRVDEEWRSAMPVGQQLLVTLLTCPALRRFGYKLRVVHNAQPTAAPS